ncbi:GNAT family N-acetyltransferase, partial [Stenotrophomonas sp.]|uniref:GNAT family N-acetyltransferase n=1 Tax=Stenotrophomonas sp. TaxID=69392 RepID=UPI002FC7892F
MTLCYRAAVADDAADCVDLRGRTRENAFSVEALAALGITVESWAEGIAEGVLPGHVAEADGRMVGYCFGDRDSGEIVVLALLPAWEGQGIGKALLARMVADFRGWGFQRLFLGCAADPAVRSHGFYRHLGWQPTGEIDDLGDEVLAYL